MFPLMIIRLSFRFEKKSVMLEGVKSPPEDDEVYEDVDVPDWGWGP